MSKLRRIDIEWGGKDLLKEVRDFALKRTLSVFASLPLVLLLLGGAASALETEGEVVAVYKNLLLIENDRGQKETVMVKENAEDDTQLENFRYIGELKRGDYVRIEYAGSVSGIKIADIIVLAKGVEPFDPSINIQSHGLNVLISGKKDFILMDLRPAGQYRAGHMPTAVSMPADAGAERVMEGLKGRKESTIIFYSGNNRDPAANKYAEEALRAGYKNVMAYLGGVEGWIKDGYYVVSTVGHVEKEFKERKPLLFVDTRHPERVKEGHIPGAVNIRPGEMRDEYIMPYEAGDQLVFYGEDEEDGSAALNALIAANWGYALRSRSPVMLLEGGFKGWKKAGFEIEKGDVPKAVTNRTKQTFGMIFYDEFEGLWREKEKGSKVILDVRSRIEAEQVKVGHVVNIPVEELPFRLSEIPKDKEVIAFCKTGVRAAMAYNILKTNGFNVRYVNRAVRLKPDGSLQ